MQVPVERSRETPHSTPRFKQDNGRRQCITLCRSARVQALAHWREMCRGGQGFI